MDHHVNGGPAWGPAAPGSMGLSADNPVNTNMMQWPASAASSNGPTSTQSSLNMPRNVQYTNNGNSANNFGHYNPNNILYLNDKQHTNGGATYMLHSQPPSIYAPADSRYLLNFQTIL
jgi:hypothetical protein